MKITYEFACQDDCLDKMVPSDLRQLVNERDQAYRNIDVLKEQVSMLQAERDALLQELRKANSIIIDLQRNPPEFTAEHLRDVQAEAVQDGLDAIGAPVTKFAKMSDDFVAGFNLCAALLQQHAAKVRQGGAE